VTLRRWGDVHAGGESCARAGEGVTFPKFGTAVHKSGGQVAEQNYFFFYGGPQYWWAHSMELALYHLSDACNFLVTSDF